MLPQLITTAGERKPFDKPLTLESMQQAVGGYIQVIETPYHAFIMDEEGKLRGKAVNRIATNLASMYLRGHDFLVGDVLVMDIDTWRAL